MANRYPLILDTTDGNKIKELPEGDNLYLRTNSIQEVQDIDALGTINAARITIAGQALQAQSILDLTDTPDTFVGQANQVLKVNASETGLDFVSISEIGDITAGNITLTGNIIPDVTATSNLGSFSKQFNEIRGRNLYGNLRGYDGTLVFDATTSRILYGAIFGAPTSLSEFINDVGYLTSSSIGDYLENNLTISNFKGSVFADDSTILVDGVSGKLNAAAIEGEFGGEVSGPVFRTPVLISETTLSITTDGPFFTQTINIEPGGDDRIINLTADSISINGEITNNISAMGGITGDLIGSVFGSDSSILVDAINSEVIAPIRDIKVLGATDSGTAVVDKINPVEYLIITVNGNTRYIPLFV